MPSALIKAQRGRAVWLKLHLALALSVGLLFALLGLTGSLGVYREDIDALFNPRLTVDAPQGNYQSLDKILAAVRKAHPGRHGAWTLEMPRSPRDMVTAWFDKPQETYFDWYAPLMVSVNPYTAEVVASRFWGRTLGTWLLDLHSHLLLGLFGRQTVGILGLLLMLSVASGLYLWWPGLKGLRRVFTVNRHAGLRRWMIDLHRLTGMFVALPLLILAVTGFFLSYPKALEALTGASGMGHGETGRVFVSTGMPNGRPVVLAAAEFIARAPFPNVELRRITTPVGDSGVYQIEFRQDSEINQRHPFTTVWLDRWSGHILDVRDPARFTPGQTLATWIWPLHSGEALGGAGRLVWFIAGQALFFLYLSGLLRWLIRRGMLADRAVDFAPLLAAGRSAMLLAYSLCLRLLQLGRKALPHVIAGLRAALRYLLTINKSLPKNVE